MEEEEFKRKLIEGNVMRQKYPDRVPVIVTKHETSPLAGTYYYRRCC